MSFPWRLTVVTCFCVSATLVGAQQLPTTEQARRLLVTRPDLVAQLRREIGASGLTPDQIRARLRAAGYPEDILDGVLSPPRGAGDSLATSLPTSEMLDAVAALGIVDSIDTSALRAELRRRSALPRPSDRRARRIIGSDSSQLADSLRSVEPDSVEMQTVVDSLGRVVTVPRPVRPKPVLRTADDSGFTVFGLRVFENSTSQFDANAAGPVDPSYRLGPGDQLVLIITGDAERSQVLDVTREGFIVVQGVGQLPVSGLTLAQLDELLFQRLRRVYSGLGRGMDGSSHFSINVARLRSNQVFVLGDVAEPGSYRVSSAGSALTALYAAGGPTSSGSMRRIEIRRGGRLVDSLDLYDYLLRADGSRDARLQNGDVVFVPVHGPRVRIFGEVVRPATYELRAGETLHDALQSAGGVTPEAVRRRIQVSRILPSDARDGSDRARVVLEVSASGAGAADSAPRIPLEAGDVVFVRGVNERVARRLSVAGSVWSPGEIGFSDGMRLSDAIRFAGGLKPDAVRSHVLVSRLRAGDSARVQLRGSLGESGGGGDLALREDDEVRVFAVGELRDVEFVAVTGAVRRPGRYAFREGMTLRDLVLLAGGLAPQAWLDQAEIARLPRERTPGQLATTQRVALDSSYLFVRDNTGRVTSPPGPAAPPGGRSGDVVLSPFDNVVIFPQPEWEAPRHVTVTGEVLHPGTFTLARKDERLVELLRRAGGVTPAAAPNGISFHRAQGRLGRVGVDLREAYAAPNGPADLLLQDGDSIDIPAASGIVEVQGAVNAPRGVNWVRGEGLDYYLRAAGGLARNADRARIYVTQPDGRVESRVVRRFLPDASPTPRAGGVIVVGQLANADKVDWFPRLGVIAQIVGSIVTIVAITKR